MIKSIAFKSYLKEYGGHSVLTLVGPMSSDPYIFSDPTVFIDGGVYYQYDNVGLSLGDGDSSSITHGLDIKLNQDKDFSDLSYALDHIGESFNRLNLIGFLGGRRDHELFNFGEVNRWLQNRQASAEVHFEGQVIMLSRGEWRLDLRGLFSLTSLQPTHVNLAGHCRYRLESTLIQPLLSKGLSNFADGVVSINCDQAVIILIPVSDSDYHFNEQV